jgi:hypothetical protein
MALTFFFPLDECYVPSHCMDQPVSVDKEQCVMEAARLVHQWPTGRIDVSRDLWDQFKNWGSFSNSVDHACLDSPRTWLLDHPSQVWFKLLSLCKTASRALDLFGMTFALSTLAYRSDFSPRLSRSLLAIATHDSFKAAACLPKGGFDLKPGHNLKFQEIRALAEQHCVPFNGSHQQHLTLQSGETRRALEYRKREAHQSECQTQCQSLAETLFLFWPPESGPFHMPTNLSGYTLIDMSSFKPKCETLFSSRFANYRLFQCTATLQELLNSIRGGTSQPYISAPAPVLPCFEPPQAAYMPITLHTLIKGRDARPVVLSSARGRRTETSTGYPKVTIDASATRDLISRLSDGPSGGFNTRYTQDLWRCVEALERSSVLDAIRSALSPSNDPSETILFGAGLWPSTGAESLLDQLSLHSREGMSSSWRSVLCSLAETLATQQRALRLNMYKRLGLDAEHAQETENIGGQGWDKLDYPDWLLIQLDANLFIRPVQASVAKAMMAPDSGTNTVMQLNMGEGKSSVGIAFVSA